MIYHIPLFLVITFMAVPGPGVEAVAPLTSQSVYHGAFAAYSIMRYHKREKSSPLKFAIDFKSGTAINETFCSEEHWFNHLHKLIEPGQYKIEGNFYGLGVIRAECYNDQALTNRTETIYKESKSDSDPLHYKVQLGKNTYTRSYLILRDKWPSGTINTYVNVAEGPIWCLYFVERLRDSVYVENMSYFENDGRYVRGHMTITKL